MDIILFLLLGVAIGFGIRSWQWWRYQLRAPVFTAQQRMHIQVEVKRGQEETLRTITRHVREVSSAGNQFAA